MTDEKWWLQPQRYVQYNMQVMDAERIDAEKIAQETRRMGATAAVINAAGIYAWYPSQVPYHNVGPGMRQDRDYFGELLDAFHKEGIRVIARFNFGFIEDHILAQNPHWASRRPDKKTQILGAERPGSWRLLHLACQNGAYLRELCIPVFEEVLKKYPIDGVFFNGGGGYPCWCADCQQEYLEKYGKPMPADPIAMERGWQGYKKEKILSKFWDCVKRIAPSVAVIGNYQPFEHHSGVGDFSIPASNLENDLKYCDLVSTEMQDNLSGGIAKLPQWNLPTVKVKAGLHNQENKKPIAIIHTCPGMDWRHTSIPKAEYLYWASQAAANEGDLWLSMTGIPDTMPDQRILETARELFEMDEKVRSYMQDSQSMASILLVNNGTKSVMAWSSVLSSLTCAYDMANPKLLTEKKMERYSLVIFPNGFRFIPSVVDALEKYLAQGGRTLIEGVSAQLLAPVKHLLGTAALMEESEPLEAAYVRLETEKIRRRIGQTELIGLRGKVVYCRPERDAVVHATFVPPFAPKQVVGAPPERASMYVSRTDFPMCLESNHGKGKLVYLPFEAGMLAEETGLSDIEEFLRTCISIAMDGRWEMEVDTLKNVMVSAYRRDDREMLQFVNGAGTRPLRGTMPCEVTIRRRWDARKPPKEVFGAISGTKLMWSLESDVLTISVPKLNIWEMVCISL